MTINMSDKILILKEDGKKKVKITNDWNELELSIMRNGFQWASCCVDEDVLRMIRDAINDYLGG